MNDLTAQEALRLWRFRHRLSQEHAAVAIGETRETWNRWENGAPMPDDFLNQLQEAKDRGFAPIPCKRRPGRPWSNEPMRWVFMGRARAGGDMRTIYEVWKPKRWSEERCARHFEQKAVEYAACGPAKIAEWQKKNGSRVDHP
jgi:hypothetical protein